MRTELIENTPAQQDSKFSNGRLSGLFCWPQWQEKNNTPAQRDSRISKSGMSPMEQKPFRKNLPAQRHSKFSNGRLSGLFCWPQGQEKNNTPAQPYSNISKYGMGHLGLMRPMGLMENEKGSVESGSKFSKLRNCPLSPSCLFSPLASVERHSKMCNFTKLSIVKQDLNHCFKAQVLSLCLVVNAFCSTELQNDQLIIVRGCRFGGDKRE